jgi:hypothetical protein
MLDHRYCYDCWRERQRHIYVPIHPRLRWLSAERLLVWLALVVIPALVVMALGHILGLW